MLLLALLSTVALEGGTVHSMVPGEPPRQATVLVENGKIVAVGEALVIPEDALRVDLTGKHLVPGLVDGMIHHDLEHDPLYLLSGITFVRDLGNDLGRILLAASPQARDAMPGPELWLCGQIFDGNPPATTEAVVAQTPEDVDAKLPRLADAGVDFLAFHLGLPEGAWRRLIELGHEHGLQVWGPIPRGGTLEEALAAGQDGVCYLEGIAGAGGSATDEEVATRIAAVARSGAAVTPLLHVYAYRLEDPGEDPPFLNLLAPYYAEWWNYDLAQRRTALADPGWVASTRSLVEKLERVTVELWKAGVPLVPGSAAPNPWLLPGEGLHDELALWVEAGIPPAEVLRLATAGAARVLGCDDERGTIQPGRVADLVATSGDPTEDLAVLRRPAGVMVRGRWLDAPLLARLREELVEAQERVRAQAALPLAVEAPELPAGKLVLQGRVESRAYGQVIAAEEYWVVRCDDGSTAWCARLVAPGGIGFPASRRTQVQRFRDDRLDQFELTIESGNLDYRVEGRMVSGQFRIKRTMGGAFLDTNSTPGRPELVDLGLALPGMILAHYRPEGMMRILYFEDLDPVLASWEMRLGDGGMYLVKTEHGPMVLTILEGGGLDKLARTEGNTTARYESVRCETFGGAGLVPRALREQAEAEREGGEDGR